jgi:hypothetical protein
VAAATGLQAARSEPVLLVDLDGGDLATVLGVASPNGGLVDWLSCDDDPPADALARMEQPISDQLSLLPWRGSGAEGRTAQPAMPQALFRPGRSDLLARVLSAESRRVIVDVGLLGGDRGRSDSLDLKISVLAMARRSSLVVRPCYLAVRAAVDMAAADDVVLVLEPGRALRPADVKAALTVEDFTVVRWDPAVARAVDAGLLAHRLPRPLRRLPAAHAESTAAQ